MTEVLRNPRLAVPSTHALVIGVSHYRHFQDGSSPSQQGIEWDMGQLTSAASSAAIVAEWLLNKKNGYYAPNAPLRTLRILLSPQEKEKLPRTIRRAIAGGDHRATRDNAERALGDFVRDCDMHKDNIAFVYVVGHGVQVSKHDSIVLLEDMGDPQHLAVLRGSIDVVGCHAGLDHDKTASTQFWFVDACRQRPDIAERFESMKGGALSLDERHGQARSTPLFLASATRESAFARPGRQTLFCEGLMDALRGTAAVGPTPPRCATWHVSTSSLGESLVTSVEKLAAAEGRTQTVVPRGTQSHAIIQRFRVPPIVPLKIHASPKIAARKSSASITQNRGSKTTTFPPGFPVEASVSAGLYTLNISAPPPYGHTGEIISIAPPLTFHSARLSK